MSEVDKQFNSTQNQNDQNNPDAYVLDIDRKYRLDFEQVVQWHQNPGSYPLHFGRNIDFFSSKKDETNVDDESVKKNYRVAELGHGNTRSDGIILQTGDFAKAYIRRRSVVKRLAARMVRSHAKFPVRLQTYKKQTSE